MYILTKQVYEKLEKKISRQKKKKELKARILLNQTRTKKQTPAAALRHTIYLFSLIYVHVEFAEY